MCDPVPIAGHGLEGVVHRHGRVAIVLDLLHHRIGHPVGETVPRDQQHRQPVGMGRARRRHHVQRPRPDGRGGDHDLPPLFCLGESNRGQRHRLFVLTAPGWQHVLHRLQRLGQAGHVAMPKNAEHPGEQGHPHPVNLGKLVAEIAHQCLRHRQANRRPHRVRLAHVISSLRLPPTINDNIEY